MVIVNENCARYSADFRGTFVVFHGDLGHMLRGFKHQCFLTCNTKTTREGERERERERGGEREGEWVSE